MKIVKIQIFITFLFCYPICIQFSLFCLEMFALSFEINENLDQLSPLRILDDALLYNSVSI